MYVDIYIYIQGGEDNGAARGLEARRRPPGRRHPQGRATHTVYTYTYISIYMYIYMYIYI